jgi:hypothetical protein
MEHLVLEEQGELHTAQREQEDREAVQEEWRQWPVGCEMSKEQEKEQGKPSWERESWQEKEMELWPSQAKWQMEEGREQVRGEHDQHGGEGK